MASTSDNNISAQPSTPRVHFERGECSYSSGSDIDLAHFPEAILVINAHDQPRVELPKPRGLVIRSSSTANESEKLHKELLESLRKNVFDVSLKLKEQPLPQLPPEAPKLEGASRRKRQRSFPAGKLTSVSLRLPKEFRRDDIVVEKLLPPGEEERALSIRKFSLSQRLSGWTIERQIRRSDGKTVDMFYIHCHEGKEWKFRSTIEVAEFIMYEAYPVANKGKEVLETSNNKSEIKRARKRRSNPLDQSDRRTVQTRKKQIKKPQHLKEVTVQTTQTQILEEKRVQEEPWMRLMWSDPDDVQYYSSTVLNTQEFRMWLHDEDDQHQPNSSTVNSMEVRRNTASTSTSAIDVTTVATN